MTRRQQKERVYRHNELDFDDREFRDRFRFSIENLQFITNLIEPQFCRPTFRSHAKPVDIQVKFALRYLASWSPMRVIIVYQQTLGGGVNQGVYFLFRLFFQVVERKVSMNYK